MTSLCADAASVLMAVASLRISPARTATLMVRIDAISGCALIDSTARRIPSRRSASRWRNGRNWRRSSGRSSRLSSRDRYRVEDALEIALEMDRRCFSPFGAGGHGHQMSGEIAAVDG